MEERMKALENMNEICKARLNEELTILIEYDELTMRQQRE